MNTAGDLLGLSKNSAIVAVVGCGGKTTLIESLAAEFRGKKVLVSPTTKCFPPASDDAVLRATEAACQNHRPVAGTQYLGIQNPATGKLEALPSQLLADMLEGYDIALLEADGSRGLPCKGWLDNEPVVPPYCTHTVGVVTISPVGRPADEDTVLRLPQFLHLTGLRRGEPITRQALTAMVCAPKGMFRHSAGRRYLMVNGVEDPRTEALALALLEDISRQYPRRFVGLAWGSAKRNRWKEFSAT